jgi:5-methylcytosine-specific restriction endonuclease McrA
MTSERLRHVYNSREWRDRVRLRVLTRDGHQCTMLVFVSGRGWTRCPATTDLTVDHTNEHAHPLDERFLRTLCRRHHGKKDGGKRVSRRNGGSR